MPAVPLGCEADPADAVELLVGLASGRYELSGRQLSVEADPDGR
jgi:hypothetical protein